MARRYSHKLYIRGTVATLAALGTGCSDTAGQQTGIGNDPATSTLGSTGAPTGTTGGTVTGTVAGTATGTGTTAAVTGTVTGSTITATSAGLTTTTGTGTTSSTVGGLATGTTADVGSTTGGEHNVDHCLMGYEPEASDATMADGHAEYTENGQTDATVQPDVIAWMERNVWQEAHFQWHQVRRCGGGGIPGGESGAINPCEYPEMLPESNECEDAQDGYEFLVMHRHMIQSLKQLWPNHTEQFEGWDQFPAEQDYPEVLRPYYTQWSAQVLADAAIADNIEDNMDRFANEGEFGMWLQCGSLSGGVGGGSLHGSLHFNGYPPQNQAHSIANQRRNLDGYLFWKLHGWIDKVWERYRIANGQSPDEPKLKDELLAQCREMDALSALIDPSLGGPDEPVELPDEAGFFHEVVRPGLEDFGCATCHGEGEEAGLRLGYNVSSADIVAGLVNVDSAYAVGYKLVVPGDPDSSWLYLKASGLSTTSGATCQGVATCTKAMPPREGSSLPAEDIENLRIWIAEGAQPPTTL